MASRTPTLLIDGDLLLWRYLSGHERDIDWGDGVSTLHVNHEEVRGSIRAVIRKWRTDLGAGDVRVALSGSRNFRKELYPDYKGNRTGRKPIGFKPLRDWLFSTGKCRSVEGIEADDLLGIWATGGKIRDPIIVSSDKDFRQIPGRLFNPSTEELLTVSPGDADHHHMHQCLTGDRADNYPGCPGVGPKRADDILAQCRESGQLPWISVVAAYERAGLGEPEALLQARLARILRVDDFDFEKKEPILWQPASSA